MRPSVEEFKRFDIAIPKIIEIGVEEGVHAKELLECFKDAKITFIDIMHFGMAQERLAAYPERANYIIKDSYIASFDFPDNYFDFIYIDGDHTAPGCSIDLVAWYPKLKPAGLFAGHDYFNTTCEVRQAVDCFARKIGVKVCTQAGLATYHTSDWWFRKP